MTNQTSTDFQTYTIKHADRFENAAAVRDCKGSISLKDNGACIRCGYPTEKVAK